MKSTMENPGTDPTMDPDSTMGPDPTIGPIKKKMYTCNYCPLDYMARNDCTTHVRKIHGKQTYVCEHCPNLFYVEKELWDHTKSTHKGMKRHLCSKCPRSYKTRVGLTHHFNGKHKIEKAVECNKCGKEFHNSYSFGKHLQLQHKPNQVYYKCNSCSRSFKYRYLLNQHMEFDHAKNGRQKLLNYMKELNVDKSLTSDTTQCKSCKIKFKCSIDLIEHLKFHHARKVKNFSCCQCKEAVYMSRAALGIHMRYDHGLLNHSCSKCPPAQRPSNTVPLKKKKPKLKSKQNKGSTVRKLNKKARLQVNDGSMLNLFNVNINSPTIKLNEKVTKSKAPWADKFIKENLPSDMELDNATNQQLENLRHNIRTAFHTLSTVPPSKLKSSMVTRILNNTSGQNIMQKHVSVLSIMFPSMTPTVQMSSISDIQPSGISVSGSKKTSPLKSSDKPNVASSNTKIEKSNFNEHLKNNSASNTLLEPIVSITDILKNVEPNLTPNVPKEKKRKRVIKEAKEIDRAVNINEQFSEIVNDYEVTDTTDLPAQIAASVPLKKRKLNNIEITPLFSRDNLNNKTKQKTDTETIEPSKLLKSNNSIQLYRIPRITVTDFKKDKLNTEKHNRTIGNIKSIIPANTQQAVIGQETFTNTSNKDLNTGVENTQTEPISADLAVSQECYTSEIHISPKLVEVKTRVPANIKKASKTTKKGKINKHMNSGVLNKQKKARDVNTDIENMQTKVTSTDVRLILQEGKTTKETNVLLKSQSVKDNLVTTGCGKKASIAPRKDEMNKYIHPDILKKHTISADIEPTSQECQINNDTHTQFTSPSVKEKSAVMADSKNVFEPPGKNKKCTDISNLNTQVKTILDVAPTLLEGHISNETHTKFTSPSVKEISAVTGDCKKAFETLRKDKKGKDTNTLKMQEKRIFEDVQTSQESQYINETHSHFTSPSVTAVKGDIKKGHETPRKDKQSKDINPIKIKSIDVIKRTDMVEDNQRVLETPKQDKKIKDLNTDIGSTQRNTLSADLPSTSQEVHSDNYKQTMTKFLPAVEKSVIDKKHQKTTKTPKQNSDLSSKIKKIFSTPKIKLSSKLDLSEPKNYNKPLSEVKIALEELSSTFNIHEKTMSTSKTDKKELEKDFSLSLIKSSKTDVEKSKHRHPIKKTELSLLNVPSHSSEKSLDPTVSSCSINEKYNKVKPPNEKSNPKSSSENLNKVDNTSSQATATKKETVSKGIKHIISDAVQKPTEVKHKDDKQIKFKQSQETPIMDSSGSGSLLLNKTQEKTTDTLSEEEKRKLSDTTSSKSQKCGDNKTHILQSNINGNASYKHSSQNEKETAEKTNTTTEQPSVEEQLLILFNESISPPKSPSKKPNYANSKPLDKSPQSQESILQSITGTTTPLLSSSITKSHTKNKEKANPTSEEISVSFGLTTEPISTSKSQDNEKKNSDDKISTSREKKSPKRNQTSYDTKIVLAPKSPFKLDNNMNDSCSVVVDSNSEKLCMKKVTKFTQETFLSQESPSATEQVKQRVQEPLLSKDQVKNLLEKQASPEKKIPVQTKVVSPLKKVTVIPTDNKVIMPGTCVTPLQIIEAAKKMYSPINKDYCTNITNRILVTNDILIKPNQCARKVPLKNVENLTKVIFSPTPRTQTGSTTTESTTTTISDKQGSTGVESTISYLKKPPTPAVISVIEPKVEKIHTKAHKSSPKKLRPHKSSKDHNRKETDLMLREKLLTSPSKKLQNENAAKITKKKHNDNETSVQPKTQISKWTNDRSLKDLKIILHRCDEIITGNGKINTTETHENIVLSTENQNKQISTLRPGQINYEEGIPNDDYHLSVDNTFCSPETQFAEVEYDETGMNLLEVANYVDVETTSSPIHSNTNSPIPMIVSPVKAYMCAYCCMKFIDEISLLNHLTEEHAYNNANLDGQAHSSKTLYKCGTCGSGFRQKEILDKHVKEQHTETSAYNCRQCSAIFLYKYNLKKHIRKVHATVINTICEICNMEFTSSNALKEHHCCASSDEQDIIVDVVTMDEETNEKLPVYEEILPAHEKIFPAQEEIFPTYEDKMDPSDPLTKVVNYEVPVTEAKSLAKKLVTYSDVISEQIVERKLSLVRKISKKSKKHKCNVCKSNLPSGLSLFNHTRLHHKHTILKCNMCRLEFLNPVNFKQHVCKSETKFECKKCKLMFPSKYLLLEHRREKHNLGTLKCDYCSKYLKSNQNLIRHITLRHMDRYDYTNMTHLPNIQTNKSRNIKPFSSDIYDDLKIINEASEKNYLENDDKSLSSNKIYSQKPYKCDICKRKFSSEKDLISHTKLKHKQRRYYKCLKCLKQFSQKVLLLKHIKYAHKIEPNKLHRCTECSAVFKFEDKLLQHHKFKHNRAENTEKPKAALNINRKRRVMSKPMRYVAPNASPIRASNASPLRAPNASPIRAPNASPIRAPNASPIRAPNASPIRAPNASPIRAPNASPIRESTMASVIAPSSEILKGKMYTCIECSATLPTNESLQRHMQWEHMKGQKCGTCGEVLANAEEFLRHMIYGHANEKISEVLPTPLALPESTFKWKTHLAYKHGRQVE